MKKMHKHTVYFCVALFTILPGAGTDNYEVACVGGKTLLPCNPRVQNTAIIWKRNHSELVYQNGQIIGRFQRRYAVETYNLTIRDVRRSDASLYLCIEDNGHGIRHRVQLYVPERDCKLVRMTAIAWQNFTFPYCMSQTWFFYEKPDSAGKLVSLTGQVISPLRQRFSVDQGAPGHFHLINKCVQKVDGGIYKCLNGSNEQMYGILLRVGTSGVKSQRNACVGWNVTQPCTACLRGANVGWRHRTTLSSSPDNVYDSVGVYRKYRDRYTVTTPGSGVHDLVIHNVQQSDSGFFDCYDDDDTDGTIIHRYQLNIQHCLTKKKVPKDDNSTRVMEASQTFLTYNVVVIALLVSSVIIIISSAVYMLYKTCKNYYKTGSNKGAAEEVSLQPNTTELNDQLQKQKVDDEQKLREVCKERDNAIQERIEITEKWKKSRRRLAAVKARYKNSETKLIKVKKELANQKALSTAIKQRNEQLENENKRHGEEAGELSKVKGQLEKQKHDYEQKLETKHTEVRHLLETKLNETKQELEKERELRIFRENELRQRSEQLENEKKLHSEKAVELSEVKGQLEKQKLDCEQKLCEVLKECDNATERKAEIAEKWQKAIRQLESQTERSKNSEAKLTQLEKELTTQKELTVVIKQRNEQLENERKVHIEKAEELSKANGQLNQLLNRTQELAIEKVELQEINNELENMTKELEKQLLLCRTDNADLQLKLKRYQMDYCRGVKIADECTETPEMVIHVSSCSNISGTGFESEIN